VGIVSSDTVNELAKKALDDEAVRFVPYSELPSRVVSGTELLAGMDAITEELSGQLDRRAAGGVLLVVMMDLGDLHVVGLAQDALQHGQDADQGVDADGHVRGPEDRDVLGQGLKLRQLCGGEPGGADDDGVARLGGLAGRTQAHFRGGEVDDRRSGTGWQQLLQIMRHGAAQEFQPFAELGPFHNPRYGKPVGLHGQPDQGRTHPPVGASKLTKARQLGTEILQEDEYLRLIGAQG